MLIPIDSATLQLSHHGLLGTLNRHDLIRGDAGLYLGSLQSNNTAGVIVGTGRSQGAFYQVVSIRLRRRYRWSRLSRSPDWCGCGWERLFEF